MTRLFPNMLAYINMRKICGIGSQLQLFVRTLPDIRFMLILEVSKLTNP